MSRNPLRMVRSLWLRFLDGPQWLRESHGLGIVFKYYRSPTLKLLFWAMAWYERMFSRPMRLLFIVIPMFAFFAMFALNSPAIPIFLFLVVLLAVDLVVGLIFLPRLNATSRPVSNAASRSTSPTGSATCGVCPRPTCSSIRTSSCRNSAASTGSSTVPCRAARNARSPWS